jgi:hypothetical protein
MAFGFGWIKNIYKRPLGVAKELRSSAQKLRAAIPTLESKESGYLLFRPTKDHELSFVSQAAHVFEEIQQHPLVAPFLRHKPKLYIVEPGYNIPGVGVVIGAQVKGKNVFLDTKTASHLDRDELKALLSHEMGHHMALDAHPRQMWQTIVRSVQPVMEKEADEIAVTITNNPRAMTSYLEKLKKIHPEIAAGEADVQKLHKGGVREQLRNLRHVVDNAVYLPAEERAAHINQVGEKVVTSEGRSHVEAEIRRRLQKVHDKLHIHHTTPVARS